MTAITSTPTAEKLRPVLAANPASTTGELAKLAGVGHSTAGKVLAAWEADGTVTRGARARLGNRVPAALWTLTSQATPEPATEPAPAAEPEPATPVEPAPTTRHLAVVRDVPAVETLPEVDEHQPTPAEDQPTDRIRAAHQDPATPPRPGMVALTCGQCSAHVVWANPPAPSAPVRCAACADPAAAPVVPEGKLAKGGLRAIVAAWLAANPSTEITPARLGRELDRSAGAVHNALETLCARGGAVRTSDKPKTYRMAGDA